ncbi:rhomboid family intramembrane serine protease [Aureisphaera galaxeae]|uniref:rhomboid family intramembrane serine protease n=1 Tax=Aureisphaera galaxeae TaxID=1538023 RepID=UPI002350B104|nr:rhomboid family intramembrane serine protease [Aureisphaera galaxeae]MDC8003483.1 rhomboid family intramembrane serine protease [Aureisphaera galaxeae]
MFRITETVKVLIITNVLFYVGALTLGEGAYKLFALQFPEHPNFRVWQILTSMWMHDMRSIGHILFNMLMLFMFGSQLEAYLGQKKFLFIYFSAGLGATALHFLILYLGYFPGYEAFSVSGFSKAEILQFMNEGQYNTRVWEVADESTIQRMFNSFHTSAAGASGAIFGILMAFAVYFPNLQIFLLFLPIPIKAKYLIGGYFALNVISAFSGIAIIGDPSTGFWAHIGGGIIGLICAWYWKKNSFNSHRLN